MCGMNNESGDMLTDEQRSLATRCLWSLQEADISVEGLILTHVRGIALTSTMHQTASTSRLTAVAVAMFLLGEHTSEAWGNGESLEVHVRVQLDPNNPDHRNMMQNWDTEFKNGFVPASDEDYYPIRDLIDIVAKEEKGAE